MSLKAKLPPFCGNHNGVRGMRGASLGGRMPPWSGAPRWAYARMLGGRMRTCSRSPSFSASTQHACTYPVRTSTHKAGTNRLMTVLRRAMTSASYFAVCLTVGGYQVADHSQLGTHDRARVTRGLLGAIRDGVPAYTSRRSSAFVCFLHPSHALFSLLSSNQIR